jgi:sugar (pentulose or hexulose) kinase
MNRIPVAAIFDIGKTNKKLFLFNEQYEIVHELQAGFAEIKDEDGDPCDDQERISSWIQESLNAVFGLEEYDIRAINFCSYGASLVHIDQQGKPLTPLYNYLKAYPQKLSREFYKKYGGAPVFSVQTASPVLGSLNSGMQLFRIKKQQPEIFKKIRYSLHLPQWLAYLISGKCFSDITSIGCHTNLWNFAQNHYHEWVYREGIQDKLAPIIDSGHTEPTMIKKKKIPVGVGLHDSSAALIPYLESFPEPFVLISTGTWCISLNPFNKKPLSIAELREDCLSYLSFQGNPVKASRIFAGYHHEHEVKRLASQFHKAENFYKEVSFDPEIVSTLNKKQSKRKRVRLTTEPGFKPVDLTGFNNYEEAYHQLMMDIMSRQSEALHLILDQENVKRIFVDGGFGNNALFMHLLADAFPGIKVYAASVPQATALGTALASHQSWNKKSLPGDIIDLKLYSVAF